MNDVPIDLPGSDLVRAGLADLGGRETEAALLVTMAAPGYVPSGWACRQVSRTRRTACTSCSRTPISERTVATTRWSGESSALRGRLSMRPPVDAARIRELATALAESRALGCGCNSPVARRL